MKTKMRCKKTYFSKFDLISDVMTWRCSYND